MGRKKPGGKTAALMFPTAPDVEGEEDEEDDGAKCYVCKDGATYESNEIVFCDKCGLSVHQYCYGVTEMPADNAPYLCTPCAHGQDPTTLPCALCGRTGGAFKPTADGQWAHVSCAMWVPEVFFGDVDAVMPIHLEHLDPARIKLKCGLCGEKGVCLQCSGKRCMVAYHPYCMFQHPRRIIRRIVPRDPMDPSAGLNFATYCALHHDLAGKPVKQNLSNRNQARAQFKVVMIEKKGSKKASGGKKAAGAGRPSSARAAAKRPEMDDEEWEDDEDDGVLVHYGTDANQTEVYRQLIQHLAQQMSNASVEDGGAGGGGGGGGVNGAAYGGGGDDDNDAPPLLTFQEWPGQQMGEEMDLDHYWAVTGSYFPEEHNKKWLQRMAECSALPTENDIIFTIPKKDDARTREDSDDEDEDGMRVARSAPGGGGGAADTAAAAAGGGGGGPSQSGDVAAKKRSGADKAEIKGAVGLSVVIDSEGRKLGVQYQLCPTGVFESSKVSNCDSEWHLWNPNGIGGGAGKETISSDDYRCVGKDNLAAGGGEGEEERIKNHAKAGEPGAPQPVYVALQDWEDVEGRSEAGVDFQGEEDDTEVCMELRQLQGRLRQWTEDKRAYMAPMIEQAKDMVDKAEKAREADRKQVIRYQRTQAWKQVARALAKGVGDQTINFNKVAEEAIPASWTVKADGRPSKEDLEAQQSKSGGSKASSAKGGSAANGEGNAEGDGTDIQEDAVCTVCFDGSTHADGLNDIVFCDGCNMCVHKLCYGMREIPEGDFYCQRCSFLQLLMARQLPFSNDTVRCCLCPFLHGGFKVTTDSRWCHLVCALFAPGAQLVNVEAMGPVDVTHVEIIDPHSLNAPACMYCGKSQGCLIDCDHIGETGHCGRRFHFLCAWFNGAYLDCRVADKSFLCGEDIMEDGSTRGYPSGIRLNKLCKEHAAGISCINKATGVVGLRDEELQSRIRNKYRVKLEGDIRLKKSVSKNKARVGRPRKDTGRGGAATDKAQGSTIAISKPQLKPLQDDKYEGYPCCVCLKPGGNAREPASGENTEGLIQCTGCSIKVHRRCYLASEVLRKPPKKKTTKKWDDGAVKIEGEEEEEEEEEEVEQEVDSQLSEEELAQWKCDACVAGVSGPACVLCPRKGGAFHATDDITATPRWVHAYCANHIPGVLLVADQEVDKKTTKVLVDTKSMPKDLQKQKCSICIRKGACIRCAHPGCSCYFHPLCAKQVGCYFKFRQSDLGGGAGGDQGDGQTLSRKQSFLSRDSIYCKAHTPPGLYLLSTGHWVDMHSIYRFRMDMDRLRLLVDVARRREKVKRSLWRSLCDHFDGCLKHIEAVVPQRKKVLQARLDAMQPLLAPEGAEGEEGGASSSSAAAGAAGVGGVVGSSNSGRYSGMSGYSLGEPGAGALANRSLDSKAPSTTQPPLPSASSVSDPSVAKAATMNGVAPSAGGGAASAAGEGGAKSMRRGLKGVGVSSVARPGGSGGVGESGAVKGPEPDVYALHVPLRESEGMRYGTLADEDGGGASSAGAGGALGGGGAASGKKRKRDSDGGDGDAGPVPTVGDLTLSGQFANSCVAALQGVGVWNGVCHRLEEPEADFDQVLRLEGCTLEEKKGGREEGKKGARGRSRGSAGSGNSSSSGGGSGTTTTNSTGRVRISEAPTKVLLDRQLLELMNGIMAHEASANDDLVTADGVEGRSKRIRKHKAPDGTVVISEQPMRRLCMPFLHLPTEEERPGFYNTVTDPVDLCTIRSRIMTFRYSNIDGMMKELQHCLATFRDGCPTDQQLVHDSERMWQVAESVLAQVLQVGVAPQVQQPEASKRIRTLTPKAQAQSAAAQPDGGAQAKLLPDVLCGMCSSVRADVPVSELELPKEQTWYCPTCITRSPEVFRHCKVHVRVTTRRGFYWRGGIIQAYEPISGKHRIVYDNGDWDFVQVSQLRLAYGSPTPSQKKGFQKAKAAITGDAGGGSSSSNNNQGGGSSSGGNSSTTVTNSSSNASKAKAASGGGGGGGGAATKAAPQTAKKQRLNPKAESGSDVLTIAAPATTTHKNPGKGIAGGPKSPGRGAATVAASPRSPNRGAGRKRDAAAGGGGGAAAPAVEEDAVATPTRGKGGTTPRKRKL